MSPTSPKGSVRASGSAAPDGAPTVGAGMTASPAVVNGLMTDGELEKFYS